LAVLETGYTRGSESRPGPSVGQEFDTNRINNATLAVAVCTAFLSACISGPDQLESEKGIDILGGKQPQRGHC
jgi:hypothetical protein